MRPYRREWAAGIATALVVSGVAGTVSAASFGTPEQRREHLLEPPPDDCGLLADVIGDAQLNDEGEPEALRTEERSAPTAYNLRGTTASGNSAAGARRLLPDLNTYRAIAPWVTVYFESGQSSSIAQPQFGPARVEYFSRRTGSYQRFRANAALTGAICESGEQSTKCFESQVTRLNNQTSVVHFKRGMRFAGRWAAQSIDPLDIELAVITVPIRMLSNGPLQGKYLARVGADYYPNPGAIPSQGAHASVGVSRLKEIGKSWTTVSFATIRNAGIQMPGAGAPISFLIGNPPLCTIDKYLPTSLSLGTDQ